ncbi:MAG TPA: hypothetical protein DEO65_01875 [Bacillus bacterium]|nr:hypothetical protein [Bacillus sp. (in: firmicutes)]
MIFPLKICSVLTVFSSNLFTFLQLPVLFQFPIIIHFTIHRGGIMMRVTISENRIILVGKAWEIQALLRKYSKQHRLLKNWLDSCTLIEY